MKNRKHESNNISTNNNINCVKVKETKIHISQSIMYLTA